MDRRQINLLSFGAAGTKFYEFENLVSATSIIGSSDPKISAWANADGGYDDFNRGRAPLSVNKVKCRVHLVTDATRDLTTLRDAAGSLTDWGVQPLLYAPYDDNPVRYGWARCTSVSMGEVAEAGTEWMQPVDFTFEMSDPRWYSHPDLFWIGQPRSIGDPGLNIAGARLFAPIDPGGVFMDIPYNGTLPTPVTITILQVGDPIEWPLEIKVVYPGNRTSDGFVFDAAALPITGGGASLIVDAAAMLVQARYTDGVGQETADGMPYFTIIGGNGFIWLSPFNGEADVYGLGVPSLWVDISGEPTLYLTFDDAWA